MIISYGATVSGFVVLAAAKTYALALSLRYGNRGTAQRRAHGRSDT